MTPVDPAHEELRRGTSQGFLAYALWGLFPLYFHALLPAGAFEILAHRILWTLVVCLLVLAVQQDWRWALETLRNLRLSLGLGAAALLIAANWVIYVFAVLTGRTYEGALGYFLNPLVTVALGVIVLGERLRRLQWAAVTVGGTAAIYLSVAGGSFPWISLSLAFSFGLYGLTKNRVGARLTAIRSLTAETAILAPIALVIVAVLARRDETTFTGYGAGHTALLLAAGVITAIPLLLFAAAARRIPLATVGLLQFVTPVLQLLCGVLLLGEHVSVALWVGFGIVWVALALLSVDSIRAVRHHRHAVASGPPGPGAGQDGPGDDEDGPGDDNDIDDALATPEPL